MLSVQDVCEIINFASRSGVVRLEFQGLKLSFQKRVDAKIEETPHTSESEVANQPPARRPTRPVSPTAEELDKVRAELARRRVHEEQAKTEEQVEARELYLADMAITDPQGFEAAMLDEAHNFNKG